MSDDLFRRLAPDNPITWSTEGLDDGCFWCGADARYDSATSERYAEHAPDCPWIAARNHLGLPLGLNVVRVPWCACGHDKWEHGNDGCTDCGCVVVVEREPHDGDSYNMFGFLSPYGFPPISAKRGAVRYITAPGGTCEASS